MPIARRALYVTPFALLPRTEGHRKRMAMTFDKLVEEGFKVDVLFISREYDWSALFDADLFRDLQSLGELTHFIHAATPEKPLGDYYEIDEWWPDQASDYCKWLFANNGYELIFCNYVFMSRVFEFCERATVKILDTHDLFADRHKLLAAHGLVPEFFYTSKRNEAIGLDRADVAIAIKDEEAKVFGHVSEAQIITLPYVETIPATERIVRRRQAGEAFRFGFFGSRNSINIKNIAEFIRFLEEKAPPEGYPFELWLFGSLCTRLKGPMPAYVRLGGMVSSPAEFYQSVDCVVNPQYFSTGLKIKIAEALAYGAPLISHRHSFEGFGAPLDTAHDCVDFGEILASMMAVVADEARLRELQEATEAVQDRQAREEESHWARIMKSAVAKSHWLYFMVNVDCFNRSRYYRHIVEMVFVTVAKSYMICLAGDREDERDCPWRQFKRKANRFAHDMTADLVEDGAVALLFDDPSRWGELVGDGRPVVLFDDAARMAAAFLNRDEQGYAALVEPDWIVVRSENAAHSPARRGTPVLVNYFRWLPWDMSVTATADQYEFAPEIWLLIGPGPGRAWPALAQRLFAGRKIRYFSEAEAEGPDMAPGSAADLMDLVFTQKLVPQMVVCLTHDEAFSAMKAWFTANGIAVRDFAHYAASRWAPAPVELLGLPKLSEFTSVPERGSLGETVSSAWEGSGWQTLAAIMKGWTGQSIAA